MPERVVDHLEVIEVDEQHGELALRASGAREGVLQPVQEDADERAERAAEDEERDHIAHARERGPEADTAQGLGTGKGGKRLPRARHISSTAGPSSRSPHSLPYPSCTSFIDRLRPTLE